MAASDILTGGCLCGHIRFEASGLPDAPHTCACGMCQRHSGAPLVAWVEYARAAVVWVGPGGAPSLWRSSPASSRAFCPICGSTLGAVDDAPVVALATGVFDDASLDVLTPKSHSCGASHPAWLDVTRA